MSAAIMLFILTLILFVLGGGVPPLIRQQIRGYVAPVTTG